MRRGVWHAEFSDRCVHIGMTEGHRMSREGVFSRLRRNSASCMMPSGE
jgi:hypothetical protein